MVISRFDVFFVDLNPALGSEINKIRPCVVISPNQMNNALNTVIVAPLTSTIKNYPMRVKCVVNNREGQIALDHLRSIDKTRLKNKIDSIGKATQIKLVETLLDMFAY